jgi:hypothetical protein
MADAIDLELVKQTALSVKALERVANDKDFANLLNPAKQLSENVVKLVQMATANQLHEFATDLREKVKLAMAQAKVLLRDKTDEALEQFRVLLSQVAKVIVQLMGELKQRVGARPSVIFPVRFCEAIPLLFLGWQKSLFRASLFLH